MKSFLSEHFSVILWTVLVVGIGSWLYFGFSNNQSNKMSDTECYSVHSRTYDRYGINDTEDSYLDYDTMYDNAYDEWETVREYIDGTFVIDACSDSGCYTLDADISSGYIDTVYFPDGGYLSPSSEINSDGTASAYDSDGNAWEFIVSGSDIDEAIDSWIKDSRADYIDYKAEQQYENRYR
jgi:hypothetical protein